jgi:hypothetical protein
MEIFYKQKTDGSYFGEFHEVQPQGYITQSELPTQVIDEAVPTEVSAIKFLVQLELEGVNEANILSIIDTLPEPNRTIAKVSFKRATTFERDNPLLYLVGQAYGFDDAKLDEIFVNANKLPI